MGLKGFTGERTWYDTQVSGSQVRDRVPGQQGTCRHAGRRDRDTDHRPVRTSRHDAGTCDAVREIRTPSACRQPEALQLRDERVIRTQEKEEIQWIKLHLLAVKALPIRFILPRSCLFWTAFRLPPRMGGGEAR